MRNIWREIHKWAGLAFCLLLFLQALTGFLLAHKEALWRVFHPEVRQIETTGSADYDLVRANLKRAFPEQHLARLIFDGENPNYLIARIYDGKKLTIALVDATSAEALSSGSVWQYPLELAAQLHFNLLAGKTGHKVLMVEGLLLVAMSITGLVIWWPKQRWRSAFAIRYRAPFALLLRDLHTVPAVLAAPFFILSGLTGFALVADPIVKPIVAAFAPLGSPPKLELEALEEPNAMVSINETYGMFHERFRDGKMRQLRFSADGRLVTVIMAATAQTNPRAHHIAIADRWSGRLFIYADAKAQESGDAFMGWFIPVHTGEAWPQMRGPLLSFTAIVLAMGSLTGPAIWLLRRARRRR